MKKEITTIRITTSTNEKIKKLKARYKYRSIDELINDTSLYFDEYNVSPREASKPITEQFKNIDKSFRSFFREFENKSFIPQMEMQNKVNLRLIEFIENNTLKIENKTEEINKNDGVYLSKDDYKKFKRLIELSKIIHEEKKQIPHDNNTYWGIESKLYFKFIDLIHEIKI